MTITDEDRLRWISQALALAALVVVLELGLLSALLTGLLVYQLVEFGSRRLSRVGVVPSNGRIILLITVVLLFGTLLTFGVIGLLAQFSSGPEGMSALMQKLADTVDTSRTYIPLWLQHYIPATVDEWKIAASKWLRQYALEVGLIGKETGVFFIHVIIGMAIGGIVAMDSTVRKRRSSIVDIVSVPGEHSPHHRPGPLATALHERIDFLDRSFTHIVFSQIKISAINTLLTAIFILIVLPLAGSPIPFAKSLVVLTFVVGLLPIVGNLISNTAIFMMGLSVSPLTAVAALSYLIFIHQLEYFINARIIGSRIDAKAWEVLIAMFVMEAAFGVPGLIAAPIYYAYLKDELTARKLI